MSINIFIKNMHNSELILKYSVDSIEIWLINARKRKVSKFILEFACAKNYEIKKIINEFIIIFFISWPGEYIRGFDIVAMIKYV